jgi:peptidoglycan hydrolase-like protein with peptidoglycan-binding domain
MRPWRELRQGDHGPDVEAAQRGLWHALGEHSKNDRTGLYGPGTTADVAAFRKLKRLSPEIGGGEFGAAVWYALQPYFDGYAWMLACREPEGVTPRPALGRVPLSKGMSGSDVQAAQRALWRALGEDSTNARNGVYGDQTVIDVRRFRHAYGVNPDDPSTSIGGPLWRVLTRWMDVTAIHQAENAPPPPPPPPVDHWAQVGDEAWWAYENRGRFSYVQLRPIEGIHSPPVVLTDCTGFYLGCCQAAGVPNPNRADGVYDGYGYTGSLWERGSWTHSPRRGDLAMYGDPYGHTGHAAPYMGDGTVVSFGHNPIEHYPVRYRGDFRGLKTFHR